MAQTREAATNQEQAVEDIINYFVSYSSDEEREKRQEQLVDILQQAYKKYVGEGKTFGDWFYETFVYPFTRLRKDQLDIAMQGIKGPSDPYDRLNIVIVLLKAPNSGVVSTSLNTFVLDKLIEATGKNYQSISSDPDLKEGSKEDLRTKFIKTLVAKAEARIAAHNEKIRKQAEEKLAQEAKEQLARQPVSKRTHDCITQDEGRKNEIRDFLNQFLKGELEKKKLATVREEASAKVQAEVKAAKSMDRKQLAEVHAMLAQVYAKRRNLAAGIVMEQKKDEVKAAPAVTHDKGQVQEQPLKVTYEETVVKIKRTNKLSDNPEFAKSLAQIGGFFAEKHRAKAKGTVQEKFAEEYSAIAKHFGVKAK